MDKCNYKLFTSLIFKVIGQRVIEERTGWHPIILSLKENNIEACVTA